MAQVKFQCRNSQNHKNLFERENPINKFWHLMKKTNKADKHKEKHSPTPFEFSHPTKT